MVAAVEPPEHVWGKIRGAVSAIAPSAAFRLPELSTPPSIAPIVLHSIEVPSADVTMLSSRARRWRGIAQGVTALAACLVALISVQTYRPDLLPEGMRPKAPAVAPARPLVAVLSRDGGPPAFVMTVDVASKTFTVRRAGVDPEGTKSYELWMVSDKFTQPRSLGIIGKTDFTAKAQLASYDQDTVDNATYAITLEPQGGSPTGLPTSAPIFAGKLIEIMPQPQPRRAVASRTTGAAQGVDRSKEFSIFGGFWPRAGESDFRLGVVGGKRTRVQNIR